MSPSGVSVEALNMRIYAVREGRFQREQQRREKKEFSHEELHVSLNKARVAPVWVVGVRIRGTAVLTQLITFRL